MKYFLLTLTVYILSIINIYCQDGIRLNTPDAFPSLTLFQNFNDTYLVDNCGNLVNVWPGVNDCDNHPKLLPNGNLLYIEDNEIFERDWDNDIVLRTSHSQSNLMLEYEIIPMPNGNYLCLGRRIESLSFFANLGYNLTLSDYVYDDTVVEIEPGTGNIVWEWRISDHIIQERNSNLVNFGDIEDNIELFNLDAISDFDWDHEESFMINGFDYNPELDQIALSVRKVSEVAIIDHSTTTAEAKGHEGGRYGKGGDILYRWGNPQNYGQGTSADRKLYFQHNPNWIEHGQYKGSIIMYNNGLNRPVTSFSDRFSSIEIISPDMNADGSYIKIDNIPYSPATPRFLIDGSRERADFYSGYTSGAKVLPNGNILVTVGQSLDLIEFDNSRNKVWEYTIPRESFIFRAVKYPLDYPAFQGREVRGNGTAESPSSSYDCSYFNVNTQDINNEASATSMIQSIDEVRLTSQDTDFRYQLFNSSGQLVKSKSALSKTHTINTGDMISGMYVILIQKKTHFESIKVIIH